MTEAWPVEIEVRLFSLVCDFKPAGEKKDEHMAQIVESINKDIPEDSRYSSDQVWEKLGSFYNLTQVEAIENETEKNEDEEEPENQPSLRGRREEEERKLKSLMIQVYTRWSSATSRPKCPRMTTY